MNELEKLLEKLSTVLSESDLAAIKAELTVLTESVTKEKDKMELVLEQEVKTKYDTLLESEKTRIQSEYDAKIVDLEEHLQEQLDLYIRTEMEDAISPEIFQKVALNETLEPLVAGIVKLFSEQYVALDTDAAIVVAAKTDETEKLKVQLAESVEKNMGLHKLLEESNREKLFAEKTSGLAPNVIEKVKILSEGKDYDWLKKKIDVILEIAQTDVKKEKKPTNLLENTDLVNSDEVKPVVIEKVITEVVKPKNDPFKDLMEAAGQFV
jgi:hypothetical protein